MYRYKYISKVSDTYTVSNTKGLIAFNEMKELLFDFKIKLRFQTYLYSKKKCTKNVPNQYQSEEKGRLCSVIEKTKTEGLLQFSIGPIDFNTKGKGYLKKFRFVCDAINRLKYKIKSIFNCFY